MKKLLLTSVLLIPTAAFAFTGPQAAPTPPGYLTCGVVRHTDRDTDIKDAVFRTELMIKYNGSNAVSFDVLHHLGNGDVKDREKQYDGSIGWDEKNRTLWWKGVMWKNRTIAMKGTLRPFNPQKGTWSYSEDQFTKGQDKPTWQGVWICSEQEGD